MGYVNDENVKFEYGHKKLLDIAIKLHLNNKLKQGNFFQLFFGFVTCIYSH